MSCFVRWTVESDGTVVIAVWKAGDRTIAHTAGDRMVVIAVWKASDRTVVIAVWKAGDINVIAESQGVVLCGKLVIELLSLLCGKPVI